MLRVVTARVLKKKKEANEGKYEKGESSHHLHRGRLSHQCLLLYSVCNIRHSNSYLLFRNTQKLNLKSFGSFPVLSGTSLGWQRASNDAVIIAHSWFSGWKCYYFANPRIICSELWVNSFDEDKQCALFWQFCLSQMTDRETGQSFGGKAMKQENLFTFPLCWSCQDGM